MQCQRRAVISQAGYEGRDKYEWESFKKKKTIRFLLMVEDKVSQVSVPIRIVKRKVQAVQLKLRGLEVWFAVQ